MHWRPDGAGWVRIQMRATSLRNFGNSVYPALPVSFGGNSKSRRSLLSRVYARGSKRSHQSALECVGPNCCGLHHAPTLNSLPPECDYAAEKNAALHLYRKKKNPAAATSLRNFGNSVYHALPVSFGGHNKSCRSLLSGVYARGSIKRSHQSALEICNLWTPPLLEKDNSKNNPVYNTQV